MLWDCPAYDSIRNAFMLELGEIGLSTFRVLIVFYVLGSEAWEEYSSGLLSLCLVYGRKGED